MLPNDTISRARSDVSEQQRLATAMGDLQEAWSLAPQSAAVLAGLERFGRGAQLKDCGELARLFSSFACAGQFAGDWTSRMIAGLQRDPFGQPRLPYKSTRNAAVIVLAAVGDAELAIACYDAFEPKGQPGELTAYFAPDETHEIVLAGRAEALLVEREEFVGGNDSFSLHRRSLQKGDRLSRKGSCQARSFTRVTGRLVTLRLSRPCGDDGAVREYRLSDGALLRQASADKRESSREMMMAVLGRMGRSDAVPAIAQLARSGSDHLRWQAMRQCLALDPARGFALLGAMARAVDDPLAEAAGALRAQLLEAHPQLAQVEEKLCLAS